MKAVKSMTVTMWFLGGTRFPCVAQSVDVRTVHAGAPSGNYPHGESLPAERGKFPMTRLDHEFESIETGAGQQAQQGAESVFMHMILLAKYQMGAF
jgi:hypothetical protein